MCKELTKDDLLWKAKSYYKVDLEDDFQQNNYELPARFRNFINLSTTHSECRTLFN